MGGKIKRTYRIFLGTGRYNRFKGRLEQESVDVSVIGGLKELKQSDEWQFNSFEICGEVIEPQWTLLKEELIGDEDVF